MTFLCTWITSLLILCLWWPSIPADWPHLAGFPCSKCLWLDSGVVVGGSHVQPPWSLTPAQWHLQPGPSCQQPALPFLMLSIRLALVDWARAVCCHSLKWFTDDPQHSLVTLKQQCLSWFSFPFLFEVIYSCFNEGSHTEIVCFFFQASMSNEASSSIKVSHVIHVTMQIVITLQSCFTVINSVLSLS